MRIQGYGNQCRGCREKDTGIRPNGSDSSEKLFPQTSERIVFEVGVSPYRMGVQRVGVKGAGFGVQRRASAGGAAECGSSLLVFDLQAVFCKVRGLRGLFSYFF